MYNGNSVMMMRRERPEIQPQSMYSLLTMNLALYEFNVLINTDLELLELERVKQVNSCLKVRSIEVSNQVGLSEPRCCVVVWRAIATLGVESITMGCQ